METHETESNVESTETLTPAHWVKAQTLQYFWKALSRELDAGRTYVDCVRQLQGFFKAGNGAPTGRQLREVVNRMVQRKEAPSEFLSAWDRRRGREPGNTLIEPAASLSRGIGEESQCNPRTQDGEREEKGSNALVVIERTDVINGWSLAVVEGEPIPLIEDAELARGLGYVDPRDIRELIVRIWGNPADPGFAVRRGKTLSGQKGGRPRTPFLLTRTQAFKVIARSEAPAADAIQDKMIAVFEAWIDQRRTIPSGISLDITRLEAFLEKQNAAFSSIATSALDAATATRTELSAAVTAIESRLSALEERRDQPKKGRPASKPRPAAVPAGWLSHRSVASEHGLPSVGPTGKVVDMICRAAAFTDDPDLARVAPHGSFNTLTLMLSPECVRRLEPVLDAARETMRDYGYQVSKAKALEPRREVRPLRSQKCVLEKMVAAALAQLVLAAAA